MPPSREPDQQQTGESRLAHEARAGKASALAKLLQMHQQRTYRMCLRMLGSEDAAADAAQDTLLRAVRAIGTFDERSRFSTWLTRIAINVCLTRARSEKLRRHQSLEAPGPGTDQTPSGERLESREQTTARRVEQAEDRERVLEALGALDAEARAILLLRDGHDLEYEQIAELLGVAVGTVKSRLFRARKALRESMESPPR